MSEINYDLRSEMSDRIYFTRKGFDNGYEVLHSAVLYKFGVTKLTGVFKVKCIKFTVKDKRGHCLVKLNVKAWSVSLPITTDKINQLRQAYIDRRLMGFAETRNGRFIPPYSN